MARAKLSGSLLVCKGAPPPTTLAQQPRAFRSMGFGLGAVAVSVLAMASLNGLLLLQLSEVKRSAETALTIASSAMSRPIPAIPVAVPSSEVASAETAVFTPVPEPGAVPPAAVASASGPAIGPAPTVPASVESPEPPTTAGARVAPVAIAATPPAAAVAAPFRQTESDATAQVAPAAQPGAANLPAGQVAALLARGDVAFSEGDIASARLFYQRAAEAGDSQAALRLGGTYDPEFLVRTHLNGVRGDAAAAAHWYGRARELGAPEADILLSGIIAKKDQQP